MNSSLLGMPLAAVGEVGEGFFKERTADARLRGQAQPPLLLGLGEATHIGGYGTPALPAARTGGDLGR